HVDIAEVAQHSPEKIRALGECCSHEQSAIARALNGKLCRLCVTTLDQMLGGGDKVVEDVLFELHHAGVVPGSSEFESAPDVRDGVNSALFNPKRAVLLHPECIL